MIIFTYLITQISTGMRYYGAKYGKNSHPDQLGKSYFSSSKILKNLIKEKGIEDFKFEIRKIFNSKEEALKWEKKFLMRIKATQSKMWFNRTNGGGEKFQRALGHKCSEETKQKMRKPKSAEHRQKLKENLDKNRKMPAWTEERKLKHSERMKGANNPNFGKSDHPGALNFAKIAKSRKGKTREELYGKEKADKLRLICVKRPVEKPPCIHCNQYVRGPSHMKKFHGDNCKYKLEVSNVNNFFI